MSVEVVLRTCDTTNIHNDWRVRYCGLPKDQLVKGCVSSLIRSCQQADSVKLTVLDDHSSESTVDWLRSALESSGLDYEFVPLEGQGYNNSALAQWLRCRDSDYEFVYSIEDDYLHALSAVQEMAESFHLFEQRLHRDKIVLYPFDEPSEYNPPQRQDFVVHGSARHWRTGAFTTQVLFAKPQLFRDNWSLFELLATKYNGDYLKPRTEHYEESNTIWKLWTQGDYIRFNPIPSLALHLQFEQQRDPFIDWQEWWKAYAQY